MVHLVDFDEPRFGRTENFCCRRKTFRLKQNKPRLSSIFCTKGKLQKCQFFQIQFFLNLVMSRKFSLKILKIRVLSDLNSSCFSALVFIMIRPLPQVQGMGHSIMKAAGKTMTRPTILKASLSLSLSTSILKCQAKEMLAY